MLDRSKKLLASPRFPWIAAAIAVVLFLPVLNVGLMMDDYVHRATFEGGLAVAPRPDWDLFRFIGPDRAEFALSQARGEIPWWAPPDFKLAFFRPLSGLSHAFDYHYLTDHPAVMHAENILLLAGMVLVAAVLYRRLIATAWVAGLAALLFAWDDAHSFVVVWIANRNAIFAGLFGLLAVWLHDRARKDGARAAAILAPFALALGLLSGEAALATLGYLAAYAIFLDDKAPRERLRSLAPYAVVAAMWVVVYKARGYGTSGSGFYVDPAGEPATFALAVVQRLPILLLAQFGLPPADLWPQTADSKLVPLLIATAFLAGLALVFARVLRKDRTCLFFATGMLISLVPVCATWPNDRLLLFSGFGAFGLIATFLSRAFAIEKPGPRVASRLVAGFLILVHMILAPLLLPLRARTVGVLLHDYIENAAREMPTRPASHLIVVNAPDPLIAGMAGSILFYEKKAFADHLRQLAVVVSGEETAERVDDHTLSLTATKGFFHDPFSQIFRSPSIPFHAGDVTTVPGMRTEIMELNAEGSPTRIQFRFDAPLDDPSLFWVTWKKSGFVAFNPPRQGERVSISPASLAEVLTGKAQ
ncbi:MAG: hypothetical protein ABJE95_37580 [Byssovorax sp.]